MKSIYRRIGRLETQSRRVGGQTLVRIVVRDVDTAIGFGNASCQRYRTASGTIFEVIDFYGCAFGEGKASAEEEDFSRWIDTVPIDGTLREYRPAK